MMPGVPGIHEVLAATDLSPRGDQALARAAELARAHNADLTALHVVEAVEDSWFYTVFGNRSERRARLLDEADAMLHEHARRIGIPANTETEAAIGKPDEEITRVAREYGVDMVVLGAHGAHALKGLLLGTTAQRVIRHGSGPVLIVKRAPEGPYRHVLVAADFSEYSRDALWVARELAPGAQLTLIHAFFFELDPLLLRTGATQQEMLRLKGQALGLANRRLREFATAAGLGSSDATLLVREGYPATAIAEAVTEVGADLVALGTVGRTGLRRAVLGSVAEQVLSESSVDVLVVPPVSKA